MTTHYQIQLGDEVIDFQGPDNLSDRQIERLADSQLRHAKPGQTFPHSKYAGTFEPETPTQNNSSAGGSFVRNLPRDAYFNWGDEIASAANAAIPGLASLDNAAGVSGGNQASMYGPKAQGFWDTFRNNMQDFKQQQEADESQHSTASALGNIAGVVGTLPLASERAAALLPEAVRAASRAHPLLTALGAGSAAGAISGAGAGDGNREQSAALGGLSGAALAFGLAGAIKFAPLVANYAKVLFKNGATENAVNQMRKALMRDGFDVSTPQGSAALQAELDRYGAKPVSLADVGANARARTGVGLRSPSAAQQQAIDVVGNRQAGATQRLAGDIRANVAPRTDVHALNEDLVAQRAQQAEPLREKALFEAGVPPPEGSEIVYHGGAEFDPTKSGRTYTTPDEEGARSYMGMHEERFGTPAVLNKLAVSLKNPLDLGPNSVPSKEIKDLARKAGISDENIEYGTTSSWFDPSLNPPGAADRFVNALKAKGYDGVRTLEVPWSGSAREEGKYIDAVIPFDNSSLTKISGRQSRIVDDPELQNLARLPLAQRALTAALNQAEAERGLLATTGQSIEHLPDLSRGSQLDMRTFDYLKRYLDDEVTRLYKRGDTSTFSAQEANQVKALRNAIRERLKTINPDYADYLGAYKGSSEMIDALEEGRAFDKLDPEEIAKGQGDRSTAAQELYRVGAARNLLDKIRDTRDGVTAAKRVLNSDESRAQLAATGVAPANAARLNTAVEQERTLSLLNDEMRGSATDARRLASEDANGESLPLSGGFSVGGPYGWIGLGALAKAIGRHIVPARNAAINEALLPRMLETNPAAVKGVIAELEKQGKKVEAAKLRRALIARQSSLNTGVVIGGMTALPEGDQ